MKYLILVVALAGCSTAPKPKAEYQDNFYIGCMNGMLRYEKPPKLNLKEASDWCKAQYAKVRYN